MASGDRMSARSALVWLAVLAFIPARAAEPSDPVKAGPQGFTSDFAHVIKDTDRETIDHDGNNYLRTTHVGIGVVTVPGLKGKPIAAFARELYDGWGFGKNNNTEGVLIILSIADRQSRIEVGRGLAHLIPAELADRTLREAQPLLKAGQYGEAALQMTRAIGDALNKAEGVAIDKPAAETPAPQPAPEDSQWKEFYMPGMGMMPWPVFIFMIVFLGAAFVYLPIALIVGAWRAFRSPGAGASLEDHSSSDASDDMSSDSTGPGFNYSGGDASSSSGSDSSSSASTSDMSMPPSTSVDSSSSFGSSSDSGGSSSNW